MIDSDCTTQYGRDKDTGRCLHILEAANGLACHCVCMGCEHPLIAAHPKTKRRAYFQHVPNKDGSIRECSNPAGALESAVHMLCKQTLVKLNRLYPPPFYKSFPNYRGCKVNSLIVRESSEWKLANGQEEVTIYLPYYQPDVVFETENGALLIEVLYRHRVEKPKIERLKDDGQFCIELNVSDMKPSEVGLTPLSLRLEALKYSRWISHPLSENEQRLISLHVMKEHARIDEIILKKEIEIEAEKERQLKLSAQEERVAQQDYEDRMWRPLRRYVQEKVTSYCEDSKARCISIDARRGLNRQIQTIEEILDKESVFYGEGQEDREKERKVLREDITSSITRLLDKRKLEAIERLSDKIMMQHDTKLLKTLYGYNWEGEDINLPHKEREYLEDYLEFEVDPMIKKSFIDQALSCGFASFNSIHLLCSSSDLI